MDNPVFKVGDVFHCEFCGEKAQSSTKYSRHGRDEDTTYCCKCDSYKNYENLMVKLKGIGREMDNRQQFARQEFFSNNKMLGDREKDDIRYLYELDKLDKKFKKEN